LFSRHATSRPASGGEERGFRLDRAAGLQLHAHAGLDALDHLRPFLEVELEPHALQLGAQQFGDFGVEEG